MQESFPKLISCKPLDIKFKKFQQINIHSAEFSIGRGLNHTLPLPHLAISRNHCKLIKNDRNWILEDHSTNGVTINGVVLGKGNRRQISHDDVIVLDKLNDFVYKFVNNDAELMPPVKRIKLEPEDKCNNIINDVKVLFEESQNCEMKHIEDKIESTKQIKTTNMIMKEQLQIDMKRKMEQLENDFIEKINNLKGVKNEIEMQKALLIEQRDAQLVTLKQNMEGKISDLMEQIRKHNEIESELIVENNLLKEKLLKERDEFLSELNRENSLKQDMLNKLEAKMKEQEEIRIKEKQEFELLLQKELSELAEQKKQRELQLMEELKNIKENLDDKEKQKLEVQQQLNSQLEEIQKIKDEDKQKMEQLSKAAEREIEQSALAAEKLKKQAEQSSEVINSLQDRLERVSNQLQSVESENLKLLQSKTLDKPIENTDKFGEILESELQCTICTELFMTATTLNCSHTFCKYCISKWKQKNNICPICRSAITVECPSIVLDSFIEKMVQNLTEEMKQKRKDTLRSRAELESAMSQQSDIERRRSSSEVYTDDSEAEDYQVLQDLEDPDDHEDYEDYEDYEGFEDYEDFGWWSNDNDSLDIQTIPTVDLTSLMMQPHQLPNARLLQEGEEVILVGEEIEIGYLPAAASATSATARASTRRQAAQGASTNMQNAHPYS